MQGLLLPGNRTVDVERGLWLCPRMHKQTYRRFGGLSGVCMAALLSCGGDVKTALKPGFELLNPLEPENLAEWPAATAEEKYPEAIVSVHGSKQAYDWAHARAYVHAPILDTWAAMRELDVASEDGIDKTELKAENVDPRFPYSYLYHCYAPFGQEYELTWLHGIMQGTNDAPTEIGIRYQKTWGSSFIDVHEASFQVTPVNGEITAIEMINHLKAMTQGPKNADKRLQDYFAHITARLHGQPLP
jgi:hypothetical protein